MDGNEQTNASSPLVTNLAEVILLSEHCGPGRKLHFFQMQQFQMWSSSGALLFKNRRTKRNIILKPRTLMYEKFQQASYS